MNRIHKFLLVGAFLSIAGCAPDPSEVCAHMAATMGKDADKPKFLDDEESCVERFEKVKQRHGVNSYRREVECLLGVDTSYKMRTCMEHEKGRRG